MSFLPSSFGSAHVSHQALIPSSSKKHSRESRMQRNTREDISIPGNRRVLEELHNDSRNLAASSGIHGRGGMEKSGSEKPLQPMPLPFYFNLFLLSVPVFLFHLELFLELHYTIVMANLRCSAAAESEDTLNSFTSLTLREKLRKKSGRQELS